MELRLVSSFVQEQIACFKNYCNVAILVNGPTTIIRTCTLVERQTCRHIQQITISFVGLAENKAE